jgi:hypothetical protein
VYEAMTERTQNMYDRGHYFGEVERY